MTSFASTDKTFLRRIDDNERYIRFVLLIGVTKFSKVGVFSKLDDLNVCNRTPNFLVCRLKKNRYKSQDMIHVETNDAMC